MLGEHAHFWSIHVSRSVVPPSLSPLLLIGCLAIRIKYRPTLSKLSILSIQSLSVFSTMLSLSLAPNPPPPPPLSPLSLSLSPSPCQFPLVGTLEISDEEMENIPQTAVVKGDFHNESLDDPVKESAGRQCVHPRRAREVPSVHSFSLEHPLFRGTPRPLLPLNTAFWLVSFWLCVALRAPAGALKMTTLHFFLQPNPAT